MSLVDSEKGRKWGITERTLATLITPAVHQKSLPDQIFISGISIPEPITVKQTIDTGLQSEADRIFDKYNPDYGVFVAISPDNGHILAMSDSARDGLDHGNLALQNSFPAASVSKIITAIAAVNEGKATNSTVIPFNGKSTSMYKKHVFNHENNKWTRHYSLNEAFAKSINTIFGRLGAVSIGGDTMLAYAQRLGFNGHFSSDFDFDNGNVEINPTDQWQVAEMASGYTTRNTLSPLHGAILGAIAVNGGYLVAPAIIESLIGPYGIPLYEQKNPPRSSVMSVAASLQLKQMMSATVEIGSARKSFRGFHRGDRADVLVGGKTGSLTGFKPKGKYDWFVGFAEKGDKKIAFAVLCINKEKWYVKSTRFAREILEYYFDSSPKSLEAS